MSAEKDEKEFNTTAKHQVPGTKEGEDIKFDEDINVDDIQKILQQHMDKSELDDGEEDDGDQEPELTKQMDPISVVDPSIATDESITQFVNQVVQNESIEVDVKAKKYVIQIEPENIEFMESLSINERKSIVNKILKEQNQLNESKKRESAVKKHLSHAIVASITAIIGFPLLFILVNKALEVTIANYKDSQKNFSVLYREQGKIKQIDPATIKKH